MCEPQGSGLGAGPRTLSYNGLNNAENNVLICSDSDGGSYELLCFPKDSAAQVATAFTKLIPIRNCCVICAKTVAGSQVEAQESRRGTG